MKYSYGEKDSGNVAVNTFSAIQIKENWAELAGERVWVYEKEKERVVHNC